MRNNGLAYSSIRVLYFSLSHLYKYFPRRARKSENGVKVTQFQAGGGESQLKKNYEQHRKSEHNFEQAHSFIVT